MRGEPASSDQVTRACGMAADGQMSGEAAADGQPWLWLGLNSGLSRGVADAGCGMFMELLRPLVPSAVAVWWRATSGDRWGLGDWLRLQPASRNTGALISSGAATCPCSLPPSMSAICVCACAC